MPAYEAGSIGSSSADGAATSDSAPPRSSRSPRAVSWPSRTASWRGPAETARAVRVRIRSVLEWAIAMDLRNDNPFDRVLPVLDPQNDIVQHRPALPHKDVAAAVETVRASVSAAPAIKLAFEFLVLTAARSGEVRLTTWAEIDATGSVWTIWMIGPPNLMAPSPRRVSLIG